MENDEEEDRRRRVNQPRLFFLLGVDAIGDWMYLA